MWPLRGRVVEGTQGKGRAGPRGGAAQDHPAGGYGETEGKSVRGGAAGDRVSGDRLRGSSPGGLGGLPAVPGLRRVPGLPSFPALGASDRVAAAPPSPSEHSAAAGPNHRSSWGEAARRRLRRPLRSPPPLGRAAAQQSSRGAGQSDSRLQRSTEIRPQRPRAPCPSRRVPPHPRPVAQSGERRAPHLPDRGRAERDGLVHSAPRKGRAGPAH